MHAELDNLGELAPAVAERPPEFSDDALALASQLVTTSNCSTCPHGRSGCAGTAADGPKDDTLRVFDLVRGVCRVAAARAEAEVRGTAGLNLARAICSAKTIASVERTARSDPRQVRRSDDFDADPWALNTPAGVVDLRTGALTPLRRRDLHTKATAVAPGGECPRWLKFLGEITHGNGKRVPMAAYRVLEFSSIVRSPDERGLMSIIGLTDITASNSGTRIIERGFGGSAGAGAAKAVASVLV